MMDDAVGMLVGPEMVRPGEEEGVAGGDEAAAGSRSNWIGGQGTVVGGLDDQARGGGGAMHADEVRLYFNLEGEREGERCRPKLDFVILSSFTET